MSALREDYNQFVEDYFEALSHVKNADDLEKIRIVYLSRQGSLTKLFATLKDLGPDEKREYGPLLNTLKLIALDEFELKKTQLEQERIEAENTQKIAFDVTAYKERLEGSLHPCTLVIEKLEDIFISMGFEIAQGPEVETEFYNFEALNIPSTHPARDEHDTFWLKDDNLLLRTHTSSVQIHVMSQRKPPFAIASLGRTYRHEATDATHDFMFMQCEGLVIDKNISMSHLIATVKAFVQTLFNKKDLTIRVRPSYFPFVEPGAEFDIACLFCKNGCQICKKTGWIELGGSGLVHPNVLRACNIDPEVYSGFAWGFGVERLAMLLYGINDIRLYRSNKIEFLRQF